MLDAETRAVLLADAQMQSDSWRRPDPDERVEADVHACVVCDKPLVGTVVWSANAKKFVNRRPTIGQKVCTPCNVAGWRQKPCVRCGGPTRTWDWPSKARENATRGYCRTCRAAWHKEKELVG